MSNSNVPNTNEYSTQLTCIQCSLVSASLNAAKVHSLRCYGGKNSLKVQKQTDTEWKCRFCSNCQPSKRTLFRHQNKCMKTTNASNLDNSFKIGSKRIRMEQVSDITFQQELDQEMEQENSSLPFFEEEKTNSAFIFDTEEPSLALSHDELSTVCSSVMDGLEQELYSETLMQKAISNEGLPKETQEFQALQRKYAQFEAFLWQQLTTIKQQKRSLQLLSNYQKHRNYYGTFINYRMLEKGIIQPEEIPEEVPQSLVPAIVKFEQTLQKLDPSNYKLPNFEDHRGFISQSISSRLKEPILKHIEQQVAVGRVDLTFPSNDRVTADAVMTGSNETEIDFTIFIKSDAQIKEELSIERMKAQHSKEELLYHKMREVEEEEEFLNSLEKPPLKKVTGVPVHFEESEAKEMFNMLQQYSSIRNKVCFIRKQLLKAPKQLQQTVDKLLQKIVDCGRNQRKRVLRASCNHTAKEGLQLVLDLSKCIPTYCSYPFTKRDLQFTVSGHLWNHPRKDYWSLRVPARRYKMKCAFETCQLLLASLGTLAIVVQQNPTIVAEKTAILCKLADEASVSLSATMSISRKVSNKEKESALGALARMATSFAENATLLLHPDTLVQECLYKDLATDNEVGDDIFFDLEDLKEAEEWFTGLTVGPLKILGKHAQRHKKLYEKVVYLSKTESFFATKQEKVIFLGQKSKPQEV